MLPRLPALAVAGAQVGDGDAYAAAASTVGAEASERVRALDVAEHRTHAAAVGDRAAARQVLAPALGGSHARGGRHPFHVDQDGAHDETPQLARRLGPRPLGT